MSCRVADDLEKTAFGGNILARHDLLTKGNDVFVGALGGALDKLDSVFGAPMSKIWDKGRELVGKKGNSRDAEQEARRVMQEFKDKGLDKEMPWASLDQALAETEAYKALDSKAQDAVAVNSFLTSTIALRFLEFSHLLLCPLLPLPLCLKL